MDAELLSAIAGLVLSLALSYIPGLSGLWDALAGDKKRAIMGLLILVAGGAVYAGACQGWWGGVACGDWQTLAGSIIAALVANQSIFKLTKG